MSFGSIDFHLFSKDDLHPAVLARLDASVPWCVGFSGGADSLALLLTLCQHWPSQRQRLVALHFNHSLRGTESDADEQFCRDVAHYLGVAFVSARWSDAPASASEAAARSARMAFFDAQLRALDSSLFFTGHHADDVAETLLMRLSRGSGSEGLSAPRPVQVRDAQRLFLRPLLNLRRAAIEEALVRTGWTWRTDSSNQSSDYFRNRIRLEVLPRWLEASGRDAVAGACASRDLLDEDQAALSTWLETLLPAHDYGQPLLDLSALNGKPVALWRRALHRWTATQGLSKQGFDLLLGAALSGRGVVSLSSGSAEIKGSVIKLRDECEVSEWGSVACVNGRTTPLPFGGEIGIQTVVYNEALLARILEGSVEQGSEAYLAGPCDQFVARCVKPGDRYHPLGMTEPVKVQDLLVNRKIPRERRRALPMLCDARGDIVWIPGFAPSEKYRVSSSSSVGGHLTYSSGTSTVFAQSQTSKCLTITTTTSAAL